MLLEIRILEMKVERSHKHTYSLSLSHTPPAPPPHTHTPTNLATQIGCQLRADDTSRSWPGSFSWMAAWSLLENQRKTAWEGRVQKEGGIWNDLEE